MNVPLLPGRIEHWPLARLRPYARNAKTHDADQVAKIAASMAEFGWTVPCLVAADGELIAGHGRVLAAAQLGIVEAPVIILGHLTEAQRRAYRIADNKLTELGGWDEALLLEELRGLMAEDFDLGLIGIPEEELDALLHDADDRAPIDDDAADTIPEALAEPITHPGDIWALGEHRLICGDATDPAVVALLMDGAQAALMFTSPPYAQQRDYGAAKENVGDWDALMQGVFAAAPVTADAQLLVNLGLVHRDGEWIPYWEGWVDWMRAQGWRRFGWYVWDQGPGLPGDWNGRLAPSHEFIFHFNRRPRKPNKTVESKHAGETLGGGGLRGAVRHLCLRAGLDEAFIDVSGLWGAVEGYVIGALESPRASISTLARRFGFDAIETEGVIRFVMRGRATVTTLAVDDLVSSREGEAFELTRGQETELPQALKWQVARADEDYDAALVEARRITIDTTRIASESFPMAIPPEEAERRCRRALMEAWIGRESATFRLPPSRLALDPADVIRLAHDGREVEFRLVSVADAEARGIEAVRQDRAAYDLPPGDPRPASLSSPVVFGTPEVVMLDLPQISEDQPAHRPLIAAHASPWPGEIAVFRSASTDGFNLLTTFGSRARIGTLAFDFFPGPTSRFDLGNALVVDLLSGTLESVTDVALFSGANAVVVETAAGIWEIVQAGAAELIAPNRYRLTRLLRGQRGTEHAMGNPAPAGARVVILDTALSSLPIAEADLGLPWNWRVGPAARAVSDASYAALDFTPTGPGLVPFAPVHVEQPWRIARSPGDLTIRWMRRSRALVADAWEQVEVPLAEDVESYDVQILDGAAIKRTLTSSTPSVLYTAAQQSADWGAPLGPGQTLAIRIYQLSNRLGRGTPATMTLQF